MIQNISTQLQFPLSPLLVFVRRKDAAVPTVIGEIKNAPNLKAVKKKATRQNE